MQSKANPEAPEFGGLGRTLTGQPVEEWREDMIDTMVRDGTVDGLKQAREAYEEEIEEHEDDEPYVYLLNSRIDIMTKAIDRLDGSND